MMQNKKHKDNVIKMSLLGIGLRLERLKYLNRAVVFVVDLFLSSFSTMGVYLLVTSLLGFRLPVVSLVESFFIAMVVSAVVFLMCRLYTIVIRHATFRELILFLRVAAIKVLALGVLVFIFRGQLYFFETLFLVVDLLVTFFSMIMFRGLLVSIYYRLIDISKYKKKRLLVYGSGKDSFVFAQWLMAQRRGAYNVLGFLVSGEKTKRMIVNSLPLYLASSGSAFEKILDNNNIEVVAFMNRQAVCDEQERLIKICSDRNVKLLYVPKLEVQEGVGVHVEFRDLNIEDLLNREQIKVDDPLVKSFLHDKVVFVSGAAGSIGSEIARQVCKCSPKRLVLYDNAETPLHNFRLELTESEPNVEIEFILGDVRSSKRISATFERVKPEIVFHAAAYKHVPLMEENPCEAVMVNVMGTKNLIDMSVKFGVKRFVMISTDKAVQPTNVMGASKRIAEMIASINNRPQNKTRFITTRFGNVLGSNGSVIHLFKKQIEHGGPVTVTDPNVVRYFMTIPEACNLVLHAASMGNGGEVFVFDMGLPVRIVDLARRMISLAGLRPDRDVEIKYVGLRPGEKLYEELLTNHEITSETQHGKIKIAHVDGVDAKRLEEQLARLIELAQVVNIDATVRLMKEIVPEFKSNNSRFEIFDKVCAG